MPTLRLVRAAALAVLASTGITACAAIWGFQDALDLRDAGDEGSDGGPPDSTIADAAPGADVSDALAPGDTGVAVEAAADAPSGPDGVADSGPSTDAAQEGAPEAGAEAGPDAVAEAAAEAAAEAGVDAAVCPTTCVPSVSGWQGPLEIFEGTGAPLPTVPACAGAYPTEAYDGLGSPDAGPAGCTCTCGPPSGQSCGAATIVYFSDGNCTQSCGGSQPIATGSCTPLTIPCGGTHFTISAPPATGGSCVPDAGKAVPPAAWLAEVRLCAPAAALTGDGCDAAAVCAPVTALPFEPQTYCVAHDGVQTCPPGFPAQRIYYASSIDSRDCTPCSCSPPAGATCPGASLQAYGSNNCTGGANSFPVPGACTNLGGPKSAEVVDAAPNGGSCAPDGGQPTGVFTPTTATTICCTQ